MRLYRISLSNLSRKKSRMAFLLAGMAIGIATIVVLFSISAAMRQEIGNSLDEFGANIVVAPKSDAMALSYGGVVVGTVSYGSRELGQDILDRIRSIKDSASLANLAPKVLGAVRARRADTSSRNERLVLVVGVDFDREFAMKKWWKVDGRRPAGAGEAILGYGAAQTLAIRPGETLLLDGRGFAVTGVLEETGGQEDNAVFMSIRPAQGLLGKEGRVSMVEVAAYCNSCPIDEMVAQISQAVPEAKVSALKQAIASRMETVSRFDRFAYALSLIVLLIGALVVATTMMSSVNERTREIGVFRAVGFRKKHVIEIIMLEALITTVAGGIVGFAAGKIGAILAGPAIGGVEVALTPDIGLFAEVVLLSAVVGLLATIYPALRASNLDPAEALRFI